MLRGWTRRSAAALALAAVLGCVTQARAGDGPSKNKELDDRLKVGVYEAMALGVQLFNSGDHPGCFRVYQGSLTAIAPLLDHRPPLQAAVKKGLEAAKAPGRIPDKAFALRAVLDQVYDE